MLLITNPCHMKDLLYAMTSLIFPLVFSGCSLPWILCSTLRNVKGRGTGMSRRLDLPHFRRYCVQTHSSLFICKRRQKEKSGWHYVALKIDLPRLSIHFFGLQAWGRHLKWEGNYFQTLLLCRTEMIASFNFTIDSLNFFGLLWPFCNQAKSGQVLFLHAWFDGRMADKLNNHIWASGIHNWPITYGILLNIT
jgi:hypothetical protein